MACGRFVTHTTGFVTLSGIDFAVGNWADAIGILMVPTFFLGGVIVSAYLIDWKRHHGLKPDYSTAMIMVAIFLIVASFAGREDLFGAFGDNHAFKYDYVLMALLSAASGLQNAAITTSSGATVRTTHLTGITTDLGIGLVEAFAHRINRERYKSIRRKNLLRLGSILGFLLGGCIGGLMFVKFKYLGFVLPSLIAIYAAFIARSYSAKTL